MKHITKIAIATMALTVTPSLYSQSSPIFSSVENPIIPSTVTFAGQQVNLDRTDMYERFDRELTSMAYTHGNTLLVIKRANRYFPELIPILKKNGLPEDLIYLACIESTLNPRAYSGAKAAGIWQFIPSAGKQYGLEINEYVDERYDPVKSTEAACRYLKSAYNKYGNWESAAASYNGGMGRITKELNAQGEKSAYDLYLVDETARYIYRLIAMKLIMENPRAYGYKLKAGQLYQPVRTKTVDVNGPVEDWTAWAKKNGISYMQLREYNPWIRAKSLPNKTGKTYQVKIPLKQDLNRSTQQKTIYNKAWVTD
ncbi:MAG TPA: lytic transglycosylase domain-containing protein [Muribaculum sp.]|uniref:Lytic transglycosylase domain-containing protein n=1 Tax=Heminiphilus faecis TaxID=2601703 RepID=A0ABV4CTY1_9BACT|nr:lytic transglycosylase domain-containing protein [Heminiphilus faecis]RLT76888.1 lytic transglycosylase domain-containing protein [bacterium J10(2018)]HRF67721.1 lytic transglycosylase domain-containing protein [Muribaculum sp.]